MKKQSHPITHEQLVDLLQRGRVAYRQRDITECTRLQVQLADHIPGLSIPHQIDGPVALKQHHVHLLYVEWVHSPDDREEYLTHIVEQLEQWLSNG